MFTFVWGGIKPALDERTRNKLKLIGSNYEEELLAIIDADQLPPCYGGTGEPLDMNDHLLLHSVEEIMEILAKVRAKAECKSRMHASYVCILLHLWGGWVERRRKTGKNKNVY
jgi:hypothetical protein